MITKPVYIVDIIGAVVQAVQTEVLSTIQSAETQALGTTLIQTINYQYGHKRELIQTLAQMDTDPSLRSQKYPMIYLMQDFREQRGKLAGVYADVTLDIVIAHQTDSTYKITDRYANVFKPVLYPIYYSLVKQLTKNPMTFAGNPDMVSHDKIDRSFWGTQGVGGNDAQTLNDYVDAIELQNIQIKIDYQPCP